MPCRYEEICSIANLFDTNIKFDAKKNKHIFFKVEL